MGVHSRQFRENFCSGRQSSWDFAAAPTPIPNGLNASMISQDGNLLRPWSGMDESWDGAPRRNMPFTSGPPPAFNNPGGQFFFLN